MLEEMNMPAYDPEVPEWHATVFAERENATEDEFDDWEDAKQELRGEILNGIDPDVDAAWGAVARRRMRELRSGKVRGIPASSVFSRARRINSCGKWL